MICAAEATESSSAANTVPKRQQWDNLSWFKRWDDAWFITLQILSMEPWNHPPPPEWIGSKWWAANYRCCYWLPPQRDTAVWIRPTEEIKPRKGAPQPEVQDMWQVCRRAALCQETPHHSKPRLFVEILGHNSAFWSNKNLGDQAKHPIPDEQNCSELCAKNTAPVSSTSSSYLEVPPAYRGERMMCQWCFWNQ